MRVEDLDQLNVRIRNIDPVAYGRTRNYLDGAVSRLSPYISRGVISVKTISDHLLCNGYEPRVHEKILQQIAWREYFQRVLQERRDLHSKSLKYEQAGTRSDEMPNAVVRANTGILVIDKAIEELYDTGYMHNHARMYVASLVCNIGRCSWTMGARWMYYHLLDADVASNGCSWQWICGAFSSKKYFANQDNINRYGNSSQSGGYLNVEYDFFEDMPIPDSLRETMVPDLSWSLPDRRQIIIDTGKPTLVYNFYNLDPAWHKDQDVNRVLLLEPSHFVRYPVSERSVNFALGLAAMIPGMQVYRGEFEELINTFGISRVIYKEHPLFRYKGMEEQRDWIFPEVKGYFPSFFSYWKKCLKFL